MSWINQMEPFITENERNRIAEYLRSGGWLTEYEETAKFERMISEFLHVKYAVVVTSGTVALYLALLALGIKSRDRVIVPDYTMIATPNAVRWANAKVELCDVERNTLCLDIEQVLTDEATAAMMYVPINGRSGDMNRVVDFCKDHNIALIEDACQAFGSTFRDKFLGTFGEVGAFSFTPHKIITTGQGGAVVTNNEEIYKRVKELKDFCRVRPGVDVHTGVGFNFKFTDLQAVIGIEQLKTISERVKRKREVFASYLADLKDSTKVRFLPTDLSQVVPWFVDVITDGSRDELAAYLKSNNIGSRPFYPPIHTQSPYKRMGFRTTSSTVPYGLWLPSSLALGQRDIHRITSVAKEFFRFGE